MRFGSGEVIIMLLVWLMPLLILGWVFSLANRAVRALESIAESLHQPKQ
jgi:hypothetical protein